MKIGCQAVRDAQIFQASGAGNNKHLNAPLMVKVCLLQKTWKQQRQD